MKIITIEGCYPVGVEADGRIYAFTCGRYLKCYDNGLGYKAVKLKEISGGRRQQYVHRLVAIAFIDNESGATDVNHIDGNKSNNHAENLAWVTRKENMQHAFDNRLLDGFVARYY